MIKIGKPREKLLILPRTRRTMSQRVQGGLKKQSCLWCFLWSVLHAGGFLLREWGGFRREMLGQEAAGRGHGQPRCGWSPLCPLWSHAWGLPWGRSPCHFVTLSPYHWVAPNPGCVGKTTALNYRERAGPSFSFSVRGDVSRIKWIRIFSVNQKPR